MTDDMSRLFLITPVLTEAAGVTDDLLAAVKAGDVACVLLRHGARDERGAKALLRSVAGPLQAAGAALLVEGDPRLAAHAGADGAHVHGLGEPLEAAIDSLKPDRIVGVGGLLTRDDAMLAGEMDVDYLMFGEPGPDGALPDSAWTLERVGWWTEIFNVPCVGFARTIAEVGPLAAAGAEFIALGDAVFADRRGPVAAVMDAMAAIRHAAAPAGAGRS